MTKPQSDRPVSCVCVLQPMTEEGVTSDRIRLLEDVEEPEGTPAHATHRYTSHRHNQTDRHTQRCSIHACVSQRVLIARSSVCL